MKRPVRGVLVDAARGKVEVRELDGTLDGYYRALDCQCIDIAKRKIGEHYYSIFCDDEGKLRDGYIYSAYAVNGRPMLAGNLFICRHDGDGNTVSLTDDEIGEIMNDVYVLRVPGSGVRLVLIVSF